MKPIWIICTLAISFSFTQAEEGATCAAIHYKIFDTGLSSAIADLQFSVSKAEKNGVLSRADCIGIAAASRNVGSQAKRVLLYFGEQPVSPIRGDLKALFSKTLKLVLDAQEVECANSIKRNAEGIGFFINDEDVAISAPRPTGSVTAQR